MASDQIIVECIDGTFPISRTVLDTLIRQSTFLRETVTQFADEQLRLECSIVVFEQLMTWCSTHSESKTNAEAETEDAEETLVPLVSSDLDFEEKTRALAYLMTAANKYGLMELVDQCAKQLAKQVERDVQGTTRILMGV